MPWDTSEDTKHCWVCPQIGQFPVLDVPPSHQVLPPGPLPSPGCAWDFCSVGMLEALLVAPLSPQQCCILLGKKIITTELGEVKKKRKIHILGNHLCKYFPCKPMGLATDGISRSSNPNLARRELIPSVHLHGAPWPT